MGTFKKSGDAVWGGEQKPSVIQKTNTLQNGCYRHYSVPFHGKGKTVQ